ncbi:MAG: RNA methyltransferase [bacterium]|nr:RNA methyltransferase [bacterium]MDE0501217.1 RNA methyltransferase [bacterium]
MSQTSLLRTFISSPQNPRVKALVRLRTRRERERKATFLVEGYRELRRALAWKRHLEAVYCCPPLYLGDNEEKLLSEAAQAAEVVEMSEAAFRKVAYRDRPEGLLAVLRQPPLPLSGLRLGAAPLVLVVESVEKPGNLGAMLRTAEAAGADAVVVADPTTDVFNPNVVRASLGSLFTVPLAVAEGREALEWLRREDLRVIATSPAASEPCWKTDLSGRVAVVIGTEQYGLSDLWLEGADRKVSIPMSGTVDSLNAGSAAAVLLFEARRQRSEG